MSATPFEIRTARGRATVWNVVNRIPLKTFRGETAQRRAAEWLEPLRVGYLTRERH